MRSERSADWTEVLQVAMDGRLTELWTALPALVVSFDPAKRTCVVQPTIQARVEDRAGKFTWQTLPILPDVLVQFPGGGGFVLTFPLAPGDEGIVVFSARCLDAWWERGEVQVQAEQRMHDLSDGFFIPTVRSVPNVEAAISPTDVQLRSVDPAGPSVTMTPEGVATIAATTINLNGVLIINGEAYNAHMHTGVTTGGSNTGGKA
jgi:hypothetical protein